MCSWFYTYNIDFMRINKKIRNSENSPPPWDFAVFFNYWNFSVESKYTDYTVVISRLRSFIVPSDLYFELFFIFLERFPPNLGFGTRIEFSERYSSLIQHMWPKLLLKLFGCSVWLLVQLGLRQTFYKIAIAGVHSSLQESRHILFWLEFPWFQNSSASSYFRIHIQTPLYTLWLIRLILSYAYLATHEIFNIQSRTGIGWFIRHQNWPKYFWIHCSYVE